MRKWCTLCGTYLCPHPLQLPVGKKRSAAKLAEVRDDDAHKNLEQVKAAEENEDHEEHCRVIVGWVWTLQAKQHAAAYNGEDNELLKPVALDQVQASNPKATPGRQEPAAVVRAPLAKLSS